MSCYPEPDSHIRDKVKVANYVKLCNQLRIRPCYGLVTTTVLNAEISEVENKILNISS